jgi:hypothetical protein
MENDDTNDMYHITAAVSTVKTTYDEIILLFSKNITAQMVE